MSYEHDLVERTVLALGPQEPSLESLLLRRDRKRRNQRLAAGAVGLAIGIGVMVLASAFLRSAANRETGEWPSPPITTTRLVQPGEVLLDPYASGDNSTYVIAADVSTGTQRTIDGCKDGCRLIIAGRLVGRWRLDRVPPRQLRGRRVQTHRSASRSLGRGCERPASIRGGGVPGCTVELVAHRSAARLRGRRRIDPP